MFSRPECPTQAKKFDLSERTFNFARNAREFIKQVPRTLVNIEYAKQLIRSSGSVGANYIEADESLSKKDFILRLKICKKESKESVFWLRLLDIEHTDVETTRQQLMTEAMEFVLIFNAIVRKSTAEA